MKTGKSAFFLLFLVCSVLSIQAGETIGCYDQSCYLVNNQKIDQLITNEQGVFLLVDGCWLSFQGIQATADGILVLESGEWLPLYEARARSNNYVWKCPICGTWNVQNGQPCSNSNNHPK